MSYDLFFSPESEPISADQFTAYFSRRPHYTVNDGQAIYENEDTGVYFYFEYGDDDDGVAFNLNYFRPHFFGLEAAPEVDAFVSAFSLSIEDPQNDGMGEGPFSIEGFLRGWNAGNRFGYHAILSSDNRPETYVYPTADLERVWNWNFHRHALQEEAGDTLFVPKYMFMKARGSARTAMVWPDACPIYLPRTDLVLVLRDELSSNPDSEEPREVTIVEWSELESVVADFPFEDNGGFYRLDYDSPPAAVSDFIRSVPLVPHDREMGLAYDSVLNAELVDEFTKPG